MKRNVIVETIDEALGIKAKKKKSGPSVNTAEKGVIRKVVNKIREGDSQLKELIEHGYTIYQVIWAIKNKKCVGNLGSTYLEQTVAGCIRDLIKDGRLRAHLVDKYRAVFSLPPRKFTGAKKERPHAGGAPQITRGVAAQLNKARGTHGKGSSSFIR